LQVNVNVCSNSTDVRAKIAVYSGPSCGEAACLEIVDYECQDSLVRRNGVTWLANEGVHYIIFVHDFEGAGEFVLTFEQLDPTLAPSTSPSEEPSAVFSSSPSVSMMPTGPTVAPSSKPSTSECTLEINLLCAVAALGEDCSTFDCAVATVAATGEDCSTFDFVAYFDALQQYGQYGTGDHPWFSPVSVFSTRIDIQFIFVGFLPLNSGRNVTIQSLTAMTSFDGMWDLSSQAAGRELSPEGATIVLVQGVVDAINRQQYTIEWDAEGRTENGELCTGMGTSLFDVGAYTTPPTLSPTSSAQPTPVPDETGPCMITSEISCDGCFDDAGPEITACTSGYPSLLLFQATGLPCNSSDYQGRWITCVDYNTSALLYGYYGSLVMLVEVEDLTNGVPILETNYFLEFPVRFDLYNSSITPLPTEAIRITISESDSGRPLQIIEMGTACGREENDISLLTNYGALQLIGFETPSQEGVQQALNYVSFSLLVNNVGASPLEITSLSSTPPGLAERMQWILGSNVSQARERTFSWSNPVDQANLDEFALPPVLMVGAINPLSGLVCNASAVLTLPSTTTPSTPSPAPSPIPVSELMPVPGSAVTPEPTAMVPPVAPPVVVWGPTAWDAAALGEKSSTTAPIPEPAVPVP